MKSLIQAVAVAALIAVPLAASAQTSHLTRAQVRAELVQLEATGWRPGAGADPHYPEDIMAAEAKVAALNGAASGYGGAAAGVSQTGSQNRVSAADWHDMYGRP